MDILENYTEFGPARKSVALSDYTTLRVGGPAAMFFEPQKPEHFADLLTQLEKDDIPVQVIGAGANSVPSDAGFYGAVDGYFIWAQDEEPPNETQSSRSRLYCCRNVCSSSHRTSFLRDV